MYEISDIKSDLKIEYFLQENVCRLCWSKRGKIEITKENGSSVANICFIKLINDCLDIKVTAESAPKRLCESCIRNLQKFSKFKIFCRETDRRLCELLKIHEKSSKDSIKTERIEILPEFGAYSNEYLEYDEHLGVTDPIRSEHLRPSPSPPSLVHSDPPSEEDIPLNRLNTQNSKNPKVTEKIESRTLCSHCHLELNTVEDLKAHLKIHLNVDVTYRCYGCDTVFSTRKERLQHERKCVNLQNGFKCKECEKTLRTRKSYELHIGTHQNANSGSFKCKICTDEFDTKKELKLHARCHMKKKKYVCEHCGRVFSRPDYLHKHRMTHTGARAHACPHCPYRAAQRSSLNIHIRKHTGVRPYQCALCPQRCVSSSNLLAHARRHQPRDKGYQCKICDKKFGYKGSLDEHVNIAHELLTRTFTCPQCGSVYSRARGLRQHMKKKHGRGESTSKEQGNKSEICESEVEKNSETSDQKVMKNDTQSENRNDFDANFGILRF